MKAVLVQGKGEIEDLVWGQTPDPELKPGHVRVQVKACALNRADLLQRRGLYPPPPGETEIIGLEAAGEVVEVADDIDSSRIGERVYMLLPGGGYGEQVVVPDRMAIPIPENLSYEQAAAVPEAFFTAYEALITLGRLEPGHSVLIHAAAGGVGSAAVQIASHWKGSPKGAWVAATAGTADKLEKVKAWGADVAINYKEQSFAEAIKEQTRGGVDLIVDFIGGAYLQDNLKSLKPGGRLIVVGLMGGVQAELNLGLVLMRRLQILGLVMRSRPVDDKIAITQRYRRDIEPDIAAGRLYPVIHTVLPITEVQQAHRIMEANENLGKIVLTMP